MIIQFTKMHGLGNDFIIIDARNCKIELTQMQIVHICDRKRGVGCDQLIIIRNAKIANCGMEIFNQDGSTSGACGNAARCVAHLMGIENGVIKVGKRLLKVKKVTTSNDSYSVDMGKATVKTSEIPTICSNPLDISFSNEPILKKGYAVGIGNPHLVFFLQSSDNIDVEREGPKFEKHKFFPNGVNVSFAKVTDRNTIILNVWERGAGVTLACGSAACATSYIANLLGMVDEEVAVKLPGGNLFITVGDTVVMSGRAAFSFNGTIDI